jgi:hypothetical protein
MSYAISTYFPNQPRIFFSVGTCWALIIFFLDRFILLSFRKSDSILRDLVSPSALLRIIFAGFLGVIVAHPMAMLVFKESIDKKLIEFQAEKIAEIEGSYEAQKDPHRQRNVPLKTELDEKKDDIECFTRLLMHEQSGNAKVLDCGSTSGIVDVGPRAKTIKETIERLQNEQSQLQERYDQAELANTTVIAQIELEKQGALSKLKDIPFEGYTDRQIALEKLEDEYPQTIKATRYALMLFFILLDIIAVSFKIVTKAGPYDRAIALDESTQVNYSRYAHWRSKLEDEDREEANLRSLMVQELLAIRKGEFRRIVDDWKKSQGETIPELILKLRAIVGFRYLSSMFYDTPPLTVKFKHGWDQFQSTFTGIDWLGNLMLGILVGLTSLYFFLSQDDLAVAVVPLACYSVVQVMYDKTLKIAVNRGLL